MDELQKMLSQLILDIFVQIVGLLTKKLKQYLKDGAVSWLHGAQWPTCRKWHIQWQTIEKLEAGMTQHSIL